MKIYHYAYYIAIFLYINDCFIKSQQIENKRLSDVFVNTIQSAIKLVKKTSPLDCQDIIDKAYLQKINEDMKMLLKGSSMTMNDLTPYYNCMSDKNSNHSFYLITAAHAVNESETKPYFRNAQYYYFGLCLIDGCSNANTNIQRFFKTILFDNKPTDTVVVFSMKEDYHKQQIIYSEYCGFILIGICSIVILFALSNHTLTYLSRCCSKCQRKRNQSVQSVNQQINEFEKCFKLNENCEELLTLKIHTTSFNDEGLSYIKGIRGICMIFTIYGITYSNLRSYQMNLLNQDVFFKEMKSFFNAVIIFCIRYSPRLLFSCSGYYLSYKFTCYLDDQLDKVLNIKHNSDEDYDDDDDDEDAYVYDNPNNQMELSEIDLQKKEDLIHNLNIPILLKRDQYKIPISCLFQFYLRKTYSFLIAILFFFIICYGLFPFLDLFYDIGPYLILYYQYIQRISFVDLLGHLFQYSNFNIMELNDIYLHDNQKDGCALQLFWFIINEMFFYIFTVVLVFFTYKCKQSIPLLIFLLYLLFLSIRITFYCIYRKNPEFTTLFHLNNDKYSLFFLSPLYNYSFYLLGAFFGLLNYAFQKDLTCTESNELMDDDEDVDEEIIEISRPSIDFAFTTLDFLKDRRSYTIYFFAILFLLIILLVVLFQPIYFCFQSINELEPYKTLVSSFEVSFLYLFDIDIVVILTHFIIYSLYVKGQGRFIVRILSKRIWLIFNRAYFSYTIYLIFIIKFIFYQTESLLTCDLFNTILYGSVLACLLFIILWIHCIFFEFPLRRTNQYFIKRSSHIINNKKQK